MKVLTLIYDTTYENQITAILHRGMILPRYTRLENVEGARLIQLEKQTDANFELAPKNNMILAIGSDDVIAGLVRALQALRARLKHGLRGYVTDVVDVI
jgi:hypothetical protein